MVATNLSVPLERQNSDVCTSSSCERLGNNRSNGLRARSDRDTISIGKIALVTLFSPLIAVTAILASPILVPIALRDNFSAKKKIAIVALSILTSPILIVLSPVLVPYSYFLITHSRKEGLNNVNFSYKAW